VGTVGIAFVTNQELTVGQRSKVGKIARPAVADIYYLDRDPARPDGLVVGEATRCWFGNQFSLTWPKFDRYGVSLWIPSLGGRFDAENTVRDMAMTITGGLSKSERQHVQRRVRAAMTGLTCGGM
jgi:hypothetical protein